MAVKKSRYTTEQIVQFLLQSGGDASALKSLKIPKTQLLAAVLSSPELVSQFRQGAEKQTAKYGQFDPTQIYNPTEAANTVQLKYAQMPEKYSSFAKDFLDQVAAVGGNTYEVEQIAQKYRKNPEAYMAQYGLSVDEFDPLVNDLVKDAPNFAGAEVARQKKQFAAFNTQRKEAGITSTPTALGDVLTKQTGLKGLEALPTSLEDVASSKAKELAASLDKQNLPPRVKQQIMGSFQTQFLSQAKKKKLPVAAFSAAELVKKNLFGK